jgi:hypothetical protein
MGCLSTSFGFFLDESFQLDYPKKKSKNKKSLSQYKFLCEGVGELSPWLTQIANKRKTLGKLYGIKARSLNKIII